MKQLDLMDSNAETVSTNAPLWGTAIGWVLLLPLLFYSVNGSLVTETTSVAFRFTAMQQDATLRQVALLLVGATIMAVVLQRSRAVIRMMFQNRAVMLLPILAVMSCSWSNTPKHALVSATNLLLQTLFALFLTMRFKRHRRLELLVFAGSVAMLLSLIAVVCLPGVGIDDHQNSAWRGIFGQRNSCGAAAVFLCICAFYYKACSVTARCLKLFVIASGCLFLVMAGSRTGWELGALAMALVPALKLLNRVRAKDGLALWSVAVPILAAAGLAIAKYKDDILTFFGKNHTLTQRTIIWAVSMQAAFKHPLVGYGYASFWNGLSGESQNAVLTTGWMEAQAQSGYIDLMLQLGIAGVAVFALMLFATCKDLPRVFRAEREESAHLGWCVTTLVIFLVYNVGESSIASAFNLTWFLFLLAIVGIREHAVCRREQKTNLGSTAIAQNAA